MRMAVPAGQKLADSSRGKTYEATYHQQASAALAQQEVMKNGQA